MILNKQDLNEYLEADRSALGMETKRPRPFTDEVWRFEIALRKYEYALNCKKGFWGKFVKGCYLLVFHRLSVKLGFSIPPNTCGKGLSIAHVGTVIINSGSQIGEGLRIHTGVIVGAKSGNRGAPKIGNNVYLGGGCKVLGDITVADGVVVGANAVVVKSVLEENSVMAGIPAKCIKIKK